MPIDLTSLGDSRRLLIEADLQPVQGKRFHRPAFPTSVRRPIKPATLHACYLKALKAWPTDWRTRSGMRVVMD